MTINSALKKNVFLVAGSLITVLLLVGLVLFFLLYGTDSPGRTERFLGHLHPVLVHLPIGILIGVVIYEGTTLLYPEIRNRPILLFLLWIGFISAVASAFFGYFLALPGGYDVSYLFWHKWLGVLVAGTSGICFLIAGLEYVTRHNTGLTRRVRNVYRLFLVCMAVVLSITGHLGGTLTHGPGYLTEFLPAVVKRSLGLDKTASSLGSSDKIKEIESAEVYGDLVKPVLEKRCVSCHSASKTKGDLRLDTKKGIEEGGENGKIIQPGKPDKSELYRRITLPLWDDQVMPPDNKKPLSIGNTALIRWWIATGASFDQTVAEAKKKKPIPPAVRTKFDRITAKPKPERMVIYDSDVSPPDPKEVQRIQSNSPWLFSYLSQDQRFLELRIREGGPEELNRSVFEHLKPVNKQVAWLDVRGHELTDKAWAYLEELSLLHRVHAERTNMKDRHLKHLSDHKYLVYLNVHHTDVSDDGLTHLNLDVLEDLYVWKANVSDQKVEELRKKHPGLTIHRGEVPDYLIPGGKTEGTGIVKKMSWNTEGTFKMNGEGIGNGTKTYTDRDFTYVKVPDKLQGLPYIRTPNQLRQRGGEGEILTLELSSPATLYIAYDTRVEAPKWIKNQYEETEMEMGMKQFPDFRFRLFQKEVSAGTVTFGPNRAGSVSSDKGSITMYSVIIKQNKES